MTFWAICLGILLVDFEQSLNPDHTGLHSTWQSVICLTTDVCLNADPGVAISIPVWSHKFLEIDHEIISMVIFLHSADLFKDYCQNFMHELLVNCLFKLAQ